METKRRNNFGVPLSPEHRKKIGDAQRGRTLSIEQRAKLSVAHKGVPLTKAHAANVSAALKGRVFSMEHRKKISEAKKGRCFTPEHRAKLSEAAKAGHAAGRKYKIDPVCGIAGGIAARKRAGTFDMTPSERTLRRQMHAFMRSCLRRALMLVTLGNVTPRSHSYITRMLGYTHEQLQAHLESLFMEGMTWENYGDWHVDHICPVAYFMKRGIGDPAVVNALSNLQPLWKADNIRKRATYIA